MPTNAVDHASTSLTANPIPPPLAEVDAPAPISPDQARASAAIWSPITLVPVPSPVEPHARAKSAQPSHRSLQRTVADEPPPAINDLTTAVASPPPAALESRGAVGTFDEPSRVPAPAANPTVNIDDPGLVRRR
jgi:hypothetical protein